MQQRTRYSAHLEALPLRGQVGVVARVELDAGAAAAAHGRVAHTQPTRWLPPPCAAGAVPRHASHPPDGHACSSPRFLVCIITHMQPATPAARLEGALPPLPSSCSGPPTWTARSCSPPHLLCTRAWRSARAQSAWCRRSPASPGEAAARQQVITRTDVHLRQQHRPSLQQAQQRHSATGAYSIWPSRPTLHTWLCRANTVSSNRWIVARCGMMQGRGPRHLSGPHAHQQRLNAQFSSGPQLSSSSAANNASNSAAFLSNSPKQGGLPSQCQRNAPCFPTHAPAHPLGWASAPPPLAASPPAPHTPARSRGAGGGRQPPAGTRQGSSTAFGAFESALGGGAGSALPVQAWRQGREGEAACIRYASRYPSSRPACSHMQDAASAGTQAGHAQQATKTHVQTTGDCSTPPPGSHRPH